MEGCNYLTAEEIGEQLLDAADRVLTAHKIAPGALARWVSEIDGTKFEVTVRVKQEGRFNKGASV